MSMFGGTGRNPQDVRVSAQDAYYRDPNLTPDPKAWGRLRKAPNVWGAHTKQEVSDAADAAAAHAHRHGKATLVVPRSLAVYAQAALERRKATNVALVRSADPATAAVQPDVQPVATTGAEPTQPLPAEDVEAVQPARTGVQPSGVVAIGEIDAPDHTRTEAAHGSVQIGPAEALRDPFAP